MSNTWYPFDVKGNYFFFRFDEEVSIGRLNIAKLLPDLRSKHENEFREYAFGEPMFTTARDILDYRDGF